LVVPVSAELVTIKADVVVGVHMGLQFLLGKYGLLTDVTLQV
jgi:hypothetical protein